MKNRLEYILVGWITAFGSTTFEDFETYSRSDETLKHLKEIFDPSLEQDDDTMPPVEKNKMEDMEQDVDLTRELENAQEF